MTRRFASLMFAVSLALGAFTFVSAAEHKCCCGDKCKCEKCTCDKDCKCPGECGKACKKAKKH